MRDHLALVRFIAGRRNMPFAWGSAANDCASFAALAVEAQTGRNPLRGLHWTSEQEADAVIEVAGGLQTAVSARLRQIAPAEAMRGDVAGVMYGNVLGLMVVEGTTLVGPGPLHTMRRDRRDMIVAWSAE